MKNLLNLPILFVLISFFIAACMGENNPNTTKNTVLDQLSEQSEEVSKGRWVYGDMHIHSTASDGHNVITSILDQSFNNFGSTFLINTDHSGFKNFKINFALNRTTADGLEEIIDWTNPIEPHSHDYAKEYYGREKQVIPKKDVIEKQYSEIARYRETLEGGQYLFQGMEWTIPYTDEHATLMILDHGSQDTLIKFHNKYAKGDDNSNSLGHSLDAAAYLETNLAQQSFFFFNHPSRKHEVSIESIRHFKNTAPTTFLGMEGAPGHQRNKAARGSYAKQEPLVIEKYKDYGIAYHGRTYGGFDYMTARLGGVWDALLSEGRRFSIQSSSDFHSIFKDFWPNQYAKTHYYLENESMEGVLEAIKSGNSFVVHGDLIDRLNFTVTVDDNTATMGNELAIRAGQKVNVNIELHVPDVNQNGDSPDLAFVDLIGGITTGVIPVEHENFKKPFSDTTQILKSFEKNTAHWLVNDNTITLTHTFIIPNEGEGYYLRLRGSNHPKGTIGFVDGQGNPIIDTQKKEFISYNDIDKPEAQAIWSSELMAWADLWFYSNPIYLKK